MFWAKTVMSPMPGTAIWYWVLTPENETSVTRPGPRMLTPGAFFGASVCSMSFSGRTPMVISPV